MLTIDFTTIEDDTGLETVHKLPARWHICGNCDGKGTSCAYLGAYTRSEMDEAGPEFQEDYMAGRYDRPCDECGGSGKVLLPDRARCTKEQLAALDADIEAREYAAAEAAAERRFGC